MFIRAIYLDFRLATCCHMGMLPFKRQEEFVAFVANQPFLLLTFFNPLMLVLVAFNNVAYYGVLLIISLCAPFYRTIVYKHVQVLSPEVLPNSTVILAYFVACMTGPKIILLASLWIDASPFLMMCCFKMILLFSWCF